MAYRTTCPISPKDLKPGDILLWSETNELSTLIKQVDQGGYSHTLVYVGEEEIDGVIKPAVVHATLSGIKMQALSEIIANEAVDLLDAYRWHAEDGEELGSENYPVEPIIQNAKDAIGGAYFLSELLLGGLSMMILDDIKDAVKQIRSRIHIAKAIHIISNFKKNEEGKKPMVCVQVATTAFWNASEDKKYAIKVDLKGERKRVPHLIKKLFEFVKEYIGLKIHHHRTGDEKKNPIDGPIVLDAGSDDLPLGTCTLRDMSTSPSLTLVGSLKDTQPVDLIPIPE